MEIKFIKTKDEYTEALEEVERLISWRMPTANTPLGDRLELLVLVIGEYETPTKPWCLICPKPEIGVYVDEIGV